MTDEGALPDEPNSGGFHYSFTLGMLPIPLDCCPQSLIDEDRRALTEYLNSPSVIRTKPAPEGRADA